MRRWAASPPARLTVAPASAPDDPALRKLDDGEADAIALALARGADLVLMDDLADVVARLKATNFRYRPALHDELFRSA